ncbi:MAG: hypothetical protein ABFS14_12755, partial [Gemmatimonadota bacterium]
AGLLFTGVACLLSILFYSVFVFDGSGMLFGTDMLDQAYQLRQFGVEEIRSGRGFPLWNPFLNGGLPFLAILPGPAFYPTSLLYLVMPLYRAIGWTFVLHTALAGVFAYLAARSLSLGRWAAAVTGLAFMFTGFVVSLLYGGHDGRMFGMVLIPLAFMLLEHGLRSGRIGWFLGLGTVVALQIFTPHVQVMYFSSLCLTLYAAMRIAGVARADGGRPQALWLAGFFGLAFVVAAGLGAAQLLSTWSILDIGVRGTVESGYEFASSWALPPQELSALFLPDLLGSLGMYWGSNPFKLHTEYLGAVPLALALVALSGVRRDPRVRSCAIISAVCVLFALGAATPLHRLTYHIIPMISSFRAPSMMLGPGAFFVALLAGLGWQRVVDARAGGGTSLPWRWIWVAASPLLLFGLAAALSPEGLQRWFLNGFFPRGWSRLPSAELASQLQVGGWFLLAGVAGSLAVGQGVTQKRIPSAAVAGVLLLLVIDLWRVDVRYLDVRDPVAEFASDPAIEFMQANLRPGERAFQPQLPQGGRTYGQNELMLHDIPSVTGVLNFRLRWFDELAGGVGYQNVLRPTMWTLFDIRYLTLPVPVESDLLTPVAQAPGVHVYEVVNDLPHAFFPASVVAEREEAQAIAFTLGLEDPLGLAVVQAGQAPVAGQGRAEISALGLDRIELDVEATVGGLLFVSEIFHPAWEARVNGEPAEILRTNGAFRGVVVPAGSSSVEMTYARGELTAGFWISGLTAFGLLLSALLLGARSWRGRRQSSE